MERGGADPGADLPEEGIGGPIRVLVKRKRRGGNEPTTNTRTAKRAVPIARRPMGEDGRMKGTVEGSRIERMRGKACLDHPIRKKRQVGMLQMTRRKTRRQR